MKWNDSEGRYAVGTDGKCDLKFKKEGKGPLYYADHLPVVSSGKSTYHGLVNMVKGEILLTFSPVEENIISYII